MTQDSTPERFTETFQPDRCTLCFLAGQYGLDHLKSLLDECVNDPPTREKLSKSKGFCRRHAWNGVGTRNGLGMGLLYEALIRENLNKGPSSFSLFGGKQDSACPICESEDKVESLFARQFAAAWGQSQPMREKFSAQGVLCVPHLHKVLDGKMAGDGKKDLESAGKAALEKVLGELREFLEKQDYRRAQEKLGTEWDAWIRAVRLMAGEKP